VTAAALALAAPAATCSGRRLATQHWLGKTGFVATWSTTWNIGPGHEDLFLRAYGVEWDHERTAFYRLLYELES